MQRGALWRSGSPGSGWPHLMLRVDWLGPLIRLDGIVLLCTHSLDQALLMGQLAPGLWDATARPNTPLLPAARPGPLNHQLAAEEEAQPSDRELPS